LVVRLLIVERRYLDFRKNDGWGEVFKNYQVLLKKKLIGE